MELMQARREAYEERVALKAKHDARKAQEAARDREPAIQYRDRENNAHERVADKKSEQA